MNVYGSEDGREGNKDIFGLKTGHRTSEGQLETRDERM